MHWIVHLEGGPRRVNHAAVAIGDKIYSFGGYCSGEVQCRNEPIDVHELNTGTLRWRRIPSNSENLEREQRLKPSTSQQHSAPTSQIDGPAPGRRRARSVAELHPLAQLRYIRPTVHHLERADSSQADSDEEMSEESSRVDFENDTDAIDSDELADIEVDEEDSLSDIDEQQEEEDIEMDSDFEGDLPGQAQLHRILNHLEALGEVDGAPQEKSSSSAKELPYQRYGHTVVAYQGKAYLWGGRNDEFGSSQLLHEYDPATNQWTIVQVGGHIPPSRDGHTAVVHNHQMFIFGGFEEQNHRFSQETYAFDFPSRAWHLVATEGAAPQHRDFHTACVLDGKMFVFGGRSDEMGQYHSSQDKYCQVLKCLDLKTNKWRDVEPKGELPGGRRSHSVWTYQDKMYMFGGYQSLLDAHYNDLFEFNPTINVWRRVHPNGSLSPMARRRQCTIVVGNRVFLFGGTMPRKTENGKGLLDLADLFVLDLEPSLYNLSAAAIIRYGLHERYDHYLPRTIRRDLQYMSTANTISKTSTSRVDCTNG